MEYHIQEFKQFLGIYRDINLQFKQYNGLFTSHNDKWIRLTKNDGSFYAKFTLNQHGREFMRAVDLIPKYQPPSMDQIKSEMMSYTRKESLDFVQTPCTIGNFLKGYELKLPLNYKSEKDQNVFLEEFKPNIGDSLDNIAQYQPLRGGSYIDLHIA